MADDPGAQTIFPGAGEADEPAGARPQVDIPAVIRRIKAMEEVQRARRRILLGLALIPLSAWLAVTRYRPDHAWAPGEVATVAALLAASAILLAAGVRRLPRPDRP